MPGGGVSNNIIIMFHLLAGTLAEIMEEKGGGRMIFALHEGFFTQIKVGFSQRYVFLFL